MTLLFAFNLAFFVVLYYAWSVHHEDTWAANAAGTVVLVMAMVQALGVMLSLVPR